MPENPRTGIVNSSMLGFTHCVFGVLVSLLVGFIPEGFLSQFYRNTWVETFSPATAVIGFILGLVFSVRFMNGRGASLTWVFGMIWLVIGFLYVKSGWNPLQHIQKSSWDYAVASLFGPSSACGENFACDFHKLTFTMPFVVSVTYSLGSLVRKLAALEPGKRGHSRDAAAE